MVVHIAQLVIGPNHQRPHEMLHVELVSTAGAFAFLLGEPDVLFGNVGERGDQGKVRRKSQSGFVILCLCQSPVAALTRPPPVVIPYVINRIITRHP